MRKGLELLIGITEKIAANPLAAGGAVEGYVCIVILERVKKWKDEEIGKDMKTSEERLRKFYGLGYSYR